MPLVFVHGVSVRADDEYSENQKIRDGYFRKFALDQIVADPAKAVIKNPYWGQYGATFAWDHACLPDQKYEQFGSGNNVFEAIIAEIAPDVSPSSSNQLLLAMTQQSLVRAVDCLWTASAFTEAQGEVETALASLAWKALSYAEKNPKPSWLSQVKNDDQFVDKLLTEVESWDVPEKPVATSNQTEVESFGASDIWNHIKKTAFNIAHTAAGLVLNPAVRIVRPWAHHKASLFVGDIFVYLKTRGDVGSEGPIVKEVKAAFEQAAAARSSADDRLVIVAHSMGGNISYDILTHFLPDLTCDLFVTVGSQVGMFEELKLFCESRSDLPSATQKLLPRPTNVKRWLNVFDRADVLGYSTSRIFQNSDYEFPTYGSPLSAHSMYFYRPSFHKRLQKRILEAD